VSKWATDAEKELRSMVFGSEEYMVFSALKDSIDLTAPYYGPLDLESQYKEFQCRFFDGKVPDLSDDFSIMFAPLPYDTAGITIMPDDQRFAGRKRGLRINQSLMLFRSETKIALLHEMIHASGIRGHDDAFRMEILRLIAEGAYGQLVKQGSYDGIL